MFDVFTIRIFIAKDSILAFKNKESVPDVLSKLLREGAQQLIHQSVESELSEYLSQHQLMFKLGECVEKNWRMLRGFD